MAQYNCKKSVKRTHFKHDMGKHSSFHFKHYGKKNKERDWFSKYHKSNKSKNLSVSKEAQEKKVRPVVKQVQTVKYNDKEFNVTTIEVPESAN